MKLENLIPILALNIKTQLKIMNLDSAADFCPQCQYILELPEVMDTIECNRCGYKVYWIYRSAPFMIINQNTS